MFKKFIKQLAFTPSLQKLLTIIFVVSLCIFISARTSHAQEEAMQVNDESSNVGVASVETSKQVGNDTESNIYQPQEGDTLVQTLGKLNETDGNSLAPIDSQIGIKEQAAKKVDNAHSMLSETRSDKSAGVSATTTNEEIIGVWGTVPWQLQAGHLIFGAGIAPIGQTSEQLAQPFLADSKLQEYIPQIKQIDIAGRVILPSNSSTLFAKIPALVKITGLVNLELTAVSDMREMFADNPKLVELPLAGFKATQVKDVRRMFANIPQLEKLDLSNLDFSKVKRHGTAELFVGSNNLREITFMDRPFGQSIKTTNGQMLNHLESRESSLMHVPVDARYGGKWLQINSKVENQATDPLNRGSVLFGKQVLQNLGRKKGSAGTWVWAPALLGKAKESKAIYVSPNMSVATINALIKFNQAELVKLSAINTSAVTSWRAEPTLLINNASVDLGIRQVTWQIYTNEMAPPIDTFIGTVNLVGDQSALLVEDDWQFADDFKNYNPKKLIAEVVGPSGEKLAKTSVGVQLIDDYPKFVQAQQVLFQIKHHHWQSQKYSRKQATLIEWLGAPIIKNARLNLITVKNQQLMQGAKFDWTKSVIWPKGLSFSTRVLAELPTEIKQDSVDKPGEYIVTILLRAADGKQSSRSVKLTVLPLMADIPQSTKLVHLAAEVFEPEYVEVEHAGVATKMYTDRDNFDESQPVKQHARQQSSLPALAVNENNIWTYVGVSIIMFVLTYNQFAKYTKKASSKRTSR